MHYHFHNVNDAFRGLIQAIQYPRQVPQGLETRCSPSRAGDVRMALEPVTVTYERPCERVLFNQARDCNPFFHLFESLWMLAGRNDVAPLEHYNSQIGKVASDDGQTFNGAYGYRWRMGGNYTRRCDQLQIIVDQLRRKPESRRVVLQMWNVQDDLLNIDKTKDCCCNTHAYFALRDGYLDMTVCNRSNDLIWGMLGANVVHFSFLQEYLAAWIGCQIGVYHQFTNNLHVYLDRWKPNEWLADKEGDWYSEVQGSPMAVMPLVQDPETFDREVIEFIDNRCWTRAWKEPFLDRVASPMCWAFALHRRRDYFSALNAIDLVESEDWRIAGRNWIVKRQAAWEAKHEASVD